MSATDNLGPQFEPVTRTEHRLMSIDPFGRQRVHARGTRDHVMGEYESALPHTPAGHRWATQQVEVTERASGAPEPLPSDPRGLGDPWNEPVRDTRPPQVRKAKPWTDVKAK